MQSNDHTNTQTGTRRGDGGVYLIVCDGTEEFTVASHYAARVATARRGHVAIAHITDMNEFMHWGKVEALMRHDLRLQAEKEVWQAAKTIHETHGLFPGLYIREGSSVDKILDIIEEDKNIRALILAGSTTAASPGPLVSYFSGKGISRLRIPVIIVPGHLDQAAINAIT